MDSFMQSYFYLQFRAALLPDWFLDYLEKEESIKTRQSSQKNDEMENTPESQSSQRKNSPTMTLETTRKTVEIQAVVENGIKGNSAENGIKPNVTNNQVVPSTNC